MASLIQLDKTKAFILDITRVHRNRMTFAAILRKYQESAGDEQYASDLKAIFASRNGYETVLTKYTALQSSLQKQLGNSTVAVLEEKVAIEEEVSPEQELVVEQASPVQEEVLTEKEAPAPKKSKFKKSKR